MRKIIFLLLFLTHSVFANTLIPKCNFDELSTFENHSVVELNNMLSRAEEKSQKCQSAKISYTLFSKELQIDYLISSLNWLYEGHYLNEFTRILLNSGINKFTTPQREHLLHQQVEMYIDLVKKLNYETSPTSQFTYLGKSLSLFDEIELIFAKYLSGNSNGSLTSKVKKSLARVKDYQITQITGRTEFSLRQNRDDISYDRDLFALAKVIQRHTGEGKFFQRGLYVMSQILAKSKVIADKDKNLLQLKIINLLSSSRIRKKLLRTYHLKFSNISVTPKELAMDLLKYQIKVEETSFDIMRDVNVAIPNEKLNDEKVFLPINPKSQNKKVIWLRSLGAVGLLLAFDRPIMDAVQAGHNPTLTAITDFTNIFGEATGLFPLIAGTFSVGLVFENNSMRDAAVAALPAVILSETIVEILKAATHRQRPANSDSPYVFEGPDWTSDNTSFPSGHSAAAWAVATIFAEEFKDEYRWSPYVAYGLAAMTSFARVYKNRHWMSDVTLGAIIGHYTAKLALKWYRQHAQDAVHDLEIAPYIGEDGMGLSLVIRRRSWAEIDTFPASLLHDVCLLNNDNGVEQLYREFITEY